MNCARAGTTTATAGGIALQLCFTSSACRRLGESRAMHVRQSQSPVLHSCSRVCHLPATRVGADGGAAHAQEPDAIRLHVLDCLPLRRASRSDGQSQHDGLLAARFGVLAMGTALWRSAAGAEHARALISLAPPD